jgi:hypothetical protein
MSEKRKLFVPLDPETDERIDRLLVSIGKRLKIKMNRCSLTRMAFSVLEEQELKNGARKAKI